MRHGRADRAEPTESLWNRSKEPTVWCNVGWRGNFELHGGL